MGQGCLKLSGRLGVGAGSYSFSFPSYPSSADDCLAPPKTKHNWDNARTGTSQRSCAVFAVGDGRTETPSLRDFVEDCRYKGTSTQWSCCACHGSTYTKIGKIQRRLAWPLRKDDTQIREALQFWGTPKDIGELECCYREDWAGLAGSLGPPKSVRNKNCDPENIEQV